MNIRFYNARILTMKDGDSIFEGEIHIEGSRISRILKKGRAEEKEAGLTPEPHWDREIDAEGNLLMPGFKNAHTHSAMTFLRSYADDLPLQDWLEKQVFPMEAELSGDDIYFLSILGIMEYLTSGITANFDMYLTPDRIAQASVDCGFRTVQTGVVSNFGHTIAQLEECYLKYNEYDDLHTFLLGFHAEYTTSKELLEGVSALSHKYKAPVYTHLCETAREVEECVGRYGMTPPVFLDSLGLFDYGGGGFHCVHMAEADLELFQRKQLYAVTNPASNAKLASGTAPVREMLRRNIPLAIGTDGAASNNCLDMFREMFLVTGLAKLREQDASAVDAASVLRMATVGGARAMHLENCDVLDPGKYADIIMIDLHQPNMQPVNNIEKNLVYSGSKQNVKMTMVAGKILYEGGRFHIGVEAEEIYRQANRIIGEKRLSVQISKQRETLA